VRNKNNNLNVGGKTNYQNQNNPDYFYEDLRPKVEQSNIIPQIVSYNIFVCDILSYNLLASCFA